MFIDGNFLAIGSHDNCIYIYGVSENGRKYTRIGKCSVSNLFSPSSVSIPEVYFVALLVLSHCGTLLMCS